MKSPPITLVNGFVEGIDKLPRDIRELGLTRRIAFVMSSYRQDSVDMEFDVSQYVNVVDCVLRAVRADEVRIVMAEHGDISGSNDGTLAAEDFGEFARAHGQTISSPFVRILVMRGGRPVAAIGSEPWVSIGGPPIYHDAYVIPAFVDATWKPDAIEREVQSRCVERGITISSVVRAREDPALPPFWAALRRLIGLG